MNNGIIQGIINEATEYATSIRSDGGRKFDLDLFHEKFAELIVRECAELCDRFQERDVGMQPAECAGAIRQMFGVEK